MRTSRLPLADSTDGLVSPEVEHRLEREANRLLHDRRGPAATGYYAVRPDRRLGENVGLPPDPSPESTPQGTGPWGAHDIHTPRVRHVRLDDPGAVLDDTGHHPAEVLADDDGPAGDDPRYPHSLDHWLRVYHGDRTAALWAWARGIEAISRTKVYRARRLTSPAKITARESPPCQTCGGLVPPSSGRGGPRRRYCPPCAERRRHGQRSAAGPRPQRPEPVEDLGLQRRPRTN